MSARIHWITHSPDRLNPLKDDLVEAGYDLHGAPDSALLTILDETTPLSACEALRSERPRHPILVFTAHTSDAHQIALLHAGADDVLTLPVRSAVFLARIHALLRRRHHAPRIRRVGALELDPRGWSASWHGHPLHLTTADFELLWMLAGRPNEAVSRDDLFLELRGIPYDGLDRAIDVRVSQLRKRFLDVVDHQPPIHTVRGLGYILRS